MFGLTSGIGRPKTCLLCRQKLRRRLQLHWAAISRWPPSARTSSGVPSACGPRIKAYDYFQLGKESKATVSNISQGIAYLDKAIELDPTLGRAYSVRGWLHNCSIMFGAEAGQALRRMVEDNE